MSDEKIEVNPSAQVFPSGISHAFDTGYAMAYGVEEALMIATLQHFIITNARSGHNFREGRYWTYDRLENFPNHFPYWSKHQVYRILKSLIKQGVIIVGSFNKGWSDRTRWYSFADHANFIDSKIFKKPHPQSISADFAKTQLVYMTILSLILSLILLP